LMQETGSSFLEHQSANVPMEEVASERFGTTYKRFHRGIFPSNLRLTPSGSRVLPHEQLHVEGGISVAECDEQPPCSLPAETLHAMPIGESASEHRRYRRVYTAPAYGADAVHPSTSTIVTDLNAGPTPVPPADARPVPSVASLGAKGTRDPPDGQRSRRLRVKPSTLVLMRQNTHLDPDEACKGFSALPILQHGYGPQKSERPVWGYSYYGPWSHSPYHKHGFRGSSASLADMPPAGIKCLAPQ
jgi:hypothetical protein